MKVIFNVSGDDVEYDCPKDQPVRALKADVIARFNLDAAQIEQYLLAYEGDQLDETQTLAELGLPEGSTVILWRKGGPARTSPLNAHRRGDTTLYSRF